MIKDGLVDIDDISVLKEAEKCASKLCCTDCKAVICEEKCECWNFAKKGVELGYNKANEWHYVKDGDLPKNNTVVLVILKNKRVKISTFMENKFTIWNNDYDAYTKLYDVIAWKEITPPKEVKENENRIKTEAF